MEIELNANFCRPGHLASFEVGHSIELDVGWYSLARARGLNLTVYIERERMDCLDELVHVLLRFGFDDHHQWS